MACQNSTMGQTCPLQVDDVILERFTGQHAVRDFSDAERKCNETHAALTRLETEASEALKQVNRRHLQFFMARSLLFLYRLNLRFFEAGRLLLLSKMNLSRTVASIVGIGAAAVLITPLLMFVNPAPLTALVIYLMATVGTGVFFFLGFGAKSKGPLIILEQGARNARQNWLVALAYREQTDLALESLRAEYLAAKALYEGIMHAAHSDLNELLNTRIDAMDGVGFEHYLVRIFNALGYQVEHTGQSGDQGVDLIVEKANSRVAVQAKCWQGSVGNGAIQEVHAGMKLHKCQKCAAITNSSFTKQAWDLAKACDCQLIDGKAIPDLIRGRLRV